MPHRVVEPGPCSRVVPGGRQAPGPGDRAFDRQRECRTRPVPGVANRWSGSGPPRNRHPGGSAASYVDFTAVFMANSTCAVRRSGRLSICWHMRPSIRQAACNVAAFVELSAWRREDANERRVGGGPRGAPPRSTDYAILRGKSMAGPANAWPTHLLGARSQVPSRPHPQHGAPRVVPAATRPRSTAPAVQAPPGPSVSVPSPGPGPGP